MAIPKLLEQLSNCEVWWILDYLLPIPKVEAQLSKESQSF
jgi:hypothetical protein